MDWPIVTNTRRSYVDNIWTGFQAFDVTAAQPLKGQNQLVFADQRLAVVYPIIQKFKKTISSDPLGVTKSWSPRQQLKIALAAIDFNGFKPSASTLDGFLDQLPDIAIFHANSNNLSGTLSPNIANLPYLYELDISNNQFLGPFPIAILGMNGLNILDIRFNFFIDQSHLKCSLKTTRRAFINNNNFMQRLPDNIGTSHVTYLTLANNRFFGPIPPSISKILSSLTEILLLNNLLSGCLPYELGFLNDAVVFDAGNNRLTGPFRSH
ncbi:hypothetical protein HAX54_012364 [Datura stramonium]|uniref:Uncharacterized protein n=1 Tax=Datura stramonium TaxID=4076 RepID=A0ABS8TJN1_DATST|nr:hypothetical protein [Datura stramonium]